MGNRSNMTYQDFVEEYAYDLDRYDTYAELLGALEGDERIKKDLGYEETDDRFCDLASDIMSKGEGYCCDLCDHIVPTESIYSFDYADPDDENDIKVGQEKLKFEDAEFINCICQNCYRRLLKGDNHGKKIYRSRR